MEIYKAILNSADTGAAAAALRDAIEAQGVAADIRGLRVRGNLISVTYENREAGTRTEAKFLLAPQKDGFSLTETSYKIDGVQQDEKFGKSDLMIEDALCEER